MQIGEICNVREKGLRSGDRSAICVGPINAETLAAPSVTASGTRSLAAATLNLAPAHHLSPCSPWRAASAAAESRAALSAPSLLLRLATATNRIRRGSTQRRREEGERVRDIRRNFLTLPVSRCNGRNSRLGKACNNALSFSLSYHLRVCLAASTQTPGNLICRRCVPCGHGIRFAAYKHGALDI